MADTTVTVVLQSAERIGCSVNGNPTWLLHTDGGTFRTMSDASAGYEVDNVLPRRHRGETDPTLKLTLTPAKRVRYFEKVS